MDTSKFSRYTGSRIFWFLFGTILGGLGFWNGLKQNLTGETLIGLGLILLGIQGLLRPVVLSRVARISKEEMARDVAIGSDTLHGALSLVMAATLVVGFVMKYLVKV
ncbi:hypothetical protein ACFPOU_03705 [Massilia jejuensis]|uniref:DUF2269 family protein n=1 Tax=Massilia jejuensis TaxID=648894 RepID=A0ABW0PF72_9BURK